MHSFSELVIGGVFVAPFVGDVVVALAIFLAVRPILHLCRFEKLFSHPAVAELSLYAMILSVLTAAF
jgi:hypothetical protein